MVYTHFSIQVSCRHGSPSGIGFYVVNVHPCTGTEVLYRPYDP